MCEKCTEFDFKIARYRQIASRIIDQPTLDGIAHLIKEMTETKSEMHPELEKK